MMSQTKRIHTPRINNGPADFGGDRPSTRHIGTTNGNTEIGNAGVNRNDRDDGTWCSRDEHEKKKDHGGRRRRGRGRGRRRNKRGRLLDERGGALIKEQIAAGEIEIESRPKRIEPDDGRRKRIEPDDGRRKRGDKVWQTTKPDPAAVASTTRNTLKYWCRRYTLFARFDLGVLVDEVGFYSVCPEVLAEHMAHRSAFGTVVDPFCGAGGNAIQLAMAGRSVIAIDRDPAKIAMARRNARIYGVERRIDFRVGDAFRVMSGLRADAVVTSPPWGGPEYAWRKKFDARDLCSREDGGMAAVLRHCRRVAPRVILHVPKNIDREQSIQIGREAGFSGPAEIEVVTVDGRPNCINLYFQERIRHPLSSVVTTAVNLKSKNVHRERQTRYDNIAEYENYLTRVNEIVAHDLRIWSCFV